MENNDKDNFVETMRHSLAHVMAAAVTELFPNAKLGIGPAIDNGFYYDFDLEQPFVPADLPKIEKKMKYIIAQAQKFEYSKMSKKEAIDFFQERGEKYKIELINHLPDEEVGIFKNGKFLDLCKGPHIEHTGKIKFFKLMSIAGAYWLGDEKRPMLQRIYGIAFKTKNEIDAYIKQQEEALKRDHRKLGKQLDLYSINEKTGPGLVLWHPKGARIRHEIETYWKDEHFKNGYELLNTPHLGRSDLWKTSGHLDFYADSMYSPMEVDKIDYYAKPMNCPFHIEVYKSSNRSYRQLPLRWAELGTVYRFEKAGVLHGLMRVRGFTQDDAHIICTPEQIESETVEALRFSMNIWKTFGFTDVKAYLATRPDDAIGEPDQWETAQKSLKAAADKEGIEVEIDEGGGAFYGPKIDLKIKDSIGREWQTTTIQFDFNLPDRFNMEYKGADGNTHRPYMVHRALLGSLERFFGILIEHFAGNFPLWLSPVQVRVANITELEEDYAKEIYEKLKAKGIRADIDARSDTIGLKVRETALEKIPYLIIVGKKEKAENLISVRLRGNKNIPDLNLNDFIDNIKTEISERKLTGSYFNR
ncbi:MAG: threonine--tRNA ligase [Elusimicrobiales bacterium]|nr:threonine--tRNA ligase [Elusimicrobiales bacterium]